MMIREIQSLLWECAEDIRGGVCGACESCAKGEDRCSSCEQDRKVKALKEASDLLGHLSSFQNDGKEAPHA